MTSGKLVVSIATMNSREMLRACLTSLPAACEGVDWTAVVVDNCSDDGTREMLAADFPHVSVIVNSVPFGFGANHNQVLRSVLVEDTARWVVVLNDDTVLEPNSLYELTECARANEHLGVIGPRVVGPAGEIEQTGFLEARPLTLVLDALLNRGSAAVPGTPEWLNGCCLLFPVNVLHRVGIFDERFFMFCEDTDICLRIRALGYGAGICTQSQILHLGHGTVSRGEFSHLMQRQLQRSLFLCIRKHRGRNVAQLTMALRRGAFGLRALRAWIVGVTTRSAMKRADAAALVSLALYSPRRPVFGDRERRA